MHSRRPKNLGWPGQMLEVKGTELNTWKGMYMCLYLKDHKKQVGGRPMGRPTQRPGLERLGPRARAISSCCAMSRHEISGAQNSNGS